MKKVSKIAFSITFLIFSGVAFAGKYTLINKDLSPSIASSYKVLSPGVIEFTIDQSKKLSGDKPVRFEYIKNSLELRGVDLGVVVTGNKKKIKVRFEGSEADFLKKVSRMKIRAKNGTDIAQQGVRGDAALRALPPGLADPKPEEVLGSVVALEKAHFKVTISKVGGKGVSKQVKKMPALVLPKDGYLAIGDAVYFTPIKKVDDKWSIKGLRVHKVEK